MQRIELTLKEICKTNYPLEIQSQVTKIKQLDHSIQGNYLLTHNSIFIQNSKSK